MAERLPRCERRLAVTYLEEALLTAKNIRGRAGLSVNGEMLVALADEVERLRCPHGDSVVLHGSAFGKTVGFSSLSNTVAIQLPESFLPRVATLGREVKIVVREEVKP